MSGCAQVVGSLLMRLEFPVAQELLVGHQGQQRQSCGVEGYR